MERKHEFEGLDNPRQITLAYVCNIIWTKTSQDIGDFILDMARHECLTLKDLTEKHPGSEWEKVTIAFGLNPSIDKYQLPPFSIPCACLLPSFHQRVMKDSMQWLDVYQERGSQTRGAACICLMDAVCLTHSS